MRAFRVLLFIGCMALPAFPQIRQANPEWCGKQDEKIPVPDGVTAVSAPSEATLTLRLKNGEKKTVDLDFADEVAQVCPIAGDRLLVFADVAGGDGPWVFIVSQIDGKELDRMGGRDPMVSPDQHWLIYRGWYGRFYEIQSDNYYLYDLTKSPAANASHAPGEPSRRRVYPVANEELSRRRVHTFETSTFFWSSDSRLLAFTDSFDDVTSLVLVRVDGLIPRAYVHPITKNEACGHWLHEVEFANTKLPEVRAYFARDWQQKVACEPAIRLTPAKLRLAPTKAAKAPPVPPEDDPPPTPPVLTYTTSVANCSDASGTWVDPSGGTWSLSQSGTSITGTLTVTSGDCGAVTWKVLGTTDGKVVTMTARDPEPALNKCGDPQTKTMEATLAPDCQSGRGKVVVKP